MNQFFTWLLLLLLVVTGRGRAQPYDTQVPTAPSANRALSVTTGPTGSFDQVIYGDTLAGGWKNWSWSSGTEYARTSPVNAGRYSMAVRLYGAWAGFSLRASTPVNVADCTGGIQFWAYGGSNGNRLQLYTQAEDSGTESRHVPITLTADSWKRFIVTWDDLGNPTRVKRIILQDAVGSGHSFFVDDLRLLTLSATREAIAGTEPTAVLSPNPTDGRCRLRWYATKPGSVQLTLTDLRGRVVMQKRHDVQPGENTIDLNVSQQPGGLYLLNARQASRQRTFKLIVQR